MKAVVGIVGAVFGVLVLMFVFANIFTAFDYSMFKFWAPKIENVKREVFEQTYSYNRGMVQELENMQMEYVKAGPDQQRALASIILHRASGYPEESMPPNLRLFIRGLRRTAGL